MLSGPNAGTPRFAKRKDLFTRQPDEEVGEQFSNPPWGIYGIKRQGDLRRGECGRKVTGEKKKVRGNQFCTGVTKLLIPASSWDTCLEKGCVSLF